MSTRTNVIVLTLAGRAAGVVTRAELRRAGLAASTIDLQLRRGFLIKVWSGLYEVPELTNEVTPLFRALKAVPGSALSHWSAARLLGFGVGGAASADPVHLTAARAGSRSQLPGIVLHRTRRLDPADLHHPVERLPTTSPARTILDLAGSGIGDRRLANLVETQLVCGRPTGDELLALLDRPGQRGVAGAARLRRLLAGLLDDQPMADSMLERRFARLLRASRLSGFERQVAPPWYDGRRGVVDFANRAATLIVEVDGRRWHATTQAMSEDRRRDRLATLHGWQAVRLTASDLADRPDEVVEHLAAIIAARRSLAQLDQLAP